MKTQLSHTIILILLIALVIFFGSNYNLEGFNKLSPSEYPKDDIYPLLTSSYPYIGKDQLSNQTYDNMWKEYPVLPQGSYEQITNNFKHVKNPDEGTCAPADFCNALYDNRKVPSNVIKVLPPAPEAVDPSVRVNYYVTK